MHEGLCSFTRVAARVGLVMSAALFVIAAAAAPSFAQDEDLDDLMGGFDDDFDASEFEEEEDVAPEWMEALPGGSWAYESIDISGSIASGAVWNYLSHTVADSEGAGGTTDYGGLSRLDLDGFLQIDVALPYEWQARGELIAWYDFAYQINGRRDYNAAVLDVYEWQVDSGEAYVSGPLTDAIDLTIGRKVVNWGRSDTFRVVDVVNPLDNKEPGLVDIEDLRRSKAMVKLDIQRGPWSGQFLVIPEHRYDRGPPPGSDFIPDIFTQFGGGLTGSAPTDDRSDFTGMPGLAGKIDGRFSGWDFSLYGAYVDETQRTVDVIGAGIQNEANRFGMVGAAGNFTRGAFLFKAELAYLTGIRTLRLQIVPPPPPPPVVNPTFLLMNQQRNRLDTMVGIEWYGPDQLTVALEILNRHIFDHPGGNPLTLEITPADNFETALRVSRPFLRERLDITLLAVVFGEKVQDGGLFRASAEFEVNDSVKVEGGWLVFFDGPRLGVGAFDSNDRIYGEVKYSF